MFFHAWECQNLVSLCLSAHTARACTGQLPEHTAEMRGVAESQAPRGLLHRQPFPQQFPAPLHAAAQVPGAIVFHCGTKASDGKILTSGGRGLSVTGMGPTLRAAVDTAYAAVDRIAFDKAFYRKDIAHRAFERG